MTTCPHTKASCTCQPQEGDLCRHGEQPPYEHGPKMPAPAWIQRESKQGQAVAIPFYSAAQVHALYAEAFERGRNHQADSP